MDAVLEEVKHGDSSRERKAGAFELVLNSTACSQWLMVGADAELARETEGHLKEKREQYRGCDKNVLPTSGLKNKIKPSNLTRKNPLQAIASVSLSKLTAGDA